MASSGGGWDTFFKQELGREGIIFTSKFFWGVQFLNTTLF